MMDRESRKRELQIIYRGSIAVSCAVCLGFPSSASLYIEGNRDHGNIRENLTTVHRGTLKRLVCYD